MCTKPKAPFTSFSIKVTKISQIKVGKWWEQSPNEQVQQKATTNPVVNTSHAEINTDELRALHGL